jgi:hypothetical protein
MKWATYLEPSHLAFLFIRSLRPRDVAEIKAFARPFLSKGGREMGKAIHSYQYNDHKDSP